MRPAEMEPTTSVTRAAAAEPPHVADTARDRRVQAPPTVHVTTEARLPLQSTPHCAATLQAEPPVQMQHATAPSVAMVGPASHTPPAQRASIAVSYFRSSVRSNSSNRAKNKRKPTQVVRKEEKKELLKEIEALQLRVKALEARPGAAGAQLVDAELQNAILHESVRSQQLSLATTQSVVSGLLNGEHTNPLSTCIRLGTDRNNRRNRLLAMKERKIRHACEYVAARSRFLDPLKPHFADERFENARGDFSCVGYDVVQFANVASVKQVYDAYVSYLLNLEISVSERLGYITVRDDFDFVEGSIASYRFLTREDGIPIETHGVLFLQYFESHELAQGGPCGVVMIDCVDEDKLYPYMPTEAVRKDVVVVVVLTPHWRPSGDGPNELVVTMSAGKYFKLHRSECPLATPEAVEELRKNITVWGDEMIQTLQDLLRTSNL